MAVTRSKAMSDADVARGYREVREQEDIHAPVVRAVVQRRPTRWR